MNSFLHLVQIVSALGYCRILSPIGPIQNIWNIFFIENQKKNCRSYFVNSPIIEKYLEKNLLYNSKYHTYMTESDIHHWILLTILTCKLLSGSYEENNNEKKTGQKK